MSPGRADLETLYRDKARAEVAAAEALLPGDAVRGSGDELADVLLVKGEPGDEDREARRALAGADGDAANKALDALGLSPARYAVCSRTGEGSGSARTDRLRLIVEAVDPRVVVAVDAGAANDLGEALSSAMPRPGELARIGGRAVLVIDDFAASLGDEARKRRVWRQLQALRAVTGRGTRDGRP